MRAALVSKSCAKKAPSRWDTLERMLITTSRALARLVAVALLLAFLVGCADMPGISLADPEPGDQETPTDSDDPQGPDDPGDPQDPDGPDEPTTPGDPFPEPDEEYEKEAFVEDFDTLETSFWQIGTWTEHHGQMSADRCFVENGFLNLVLVNDPDEDLYLTSAIQTRNEYYYGRWEARLKPTHVDGVLNSFFTIDWEDTTGGGTGDGTKQEVDIEFLTKSFGGGAGEVHYAVHEEGLGSFETNPDVELSFDPSADFHVWGVEITPHYIEWFVDDQLLLRYEYGDPAYDIVIDAPYQLKLNTRTQAHWIEGPPEPNVEAVYLIDWIKFTPILNE